MTVPRRTPAHLIRGGLLVSALGLLVGCSVVGALVPSDDATDLLGVAPGGDVDLAVLAVGDCVSTVDGDILSGLDLTPCAEPHDWEVFHDLDLTGGAVPVRDGVVAAAEEGCGAAFLPFLGLADDATSDLGYTYLVPEATTPAPDGDLVVHCLVGDMSGPVVGSLAGAAR